MGLKISERRQLARYAKVRSTRQIRGYWRLSVHEIEGLFRSIKAWGATDGRRNIFIERDQPSVAKRIALVHELLHVVAEHLRTVGLITRQPDHDFITQGSAMLLYLLVASGALEGLDQQQISRFIRRRARRYRLKGVRR